MSTSSKSGGVGSRPHSTIQFPYNDLKDAEAIAHIIFDKYPHGGTINQLAAALGQTSTSGAFRNKIIGAKMFGLIEGTGKYVLTDLGRRIIDSDEEMAARVDAFLSVPLFSALYDNAQKSGGKLPTNSSGIESWIVGFGVVPNQATRARQTFHRSGKLAGFFDADPDRLIMPSLDARTYVETSSTIESMGNNLASVYADRVTAPKIMNDPLIVGMLDRLPDTGSPFPEDELNDWIETFKRNLKLIYPKGKKEGTSHGQRTTGEEVLR